MGCASSKRCRHCQSPHSPVPRSYSMHVHHPPQRKGDSYHLVALTSSTIGSLKVQISNQSTKGDDHPQKLGNRNRAGIGKIGSIGNFHENEKVANKDELSMSIIEAKAWSTMIDQKIPKVIPRTPIRTPPGEPETINTWELMEGLEDAGPISPRHFRSLSFSVPRRRDTFHDPPKCSFQQPGTGAAGKPLWLLMADEDETDSISGLSEFDPEIIATFRKSLEEMSPVAIEAPEKVVLYFTSLRGVRKTYEDCCYVRAILKGTGARVDERDVSIHSGFKEELRELLGEGSMQGGSGLGLGLGLPRVFVGTKYIGGAEEIKKLHEDGELEKLLDQYCQKADGEGECGRVCEGCGDVRFVLCESCCGSCKIYSDEHELEGQLDERKGDDYGFQRCSQCNENGLIRCPACCY